MKDDLPIVRVVGITRWFLSDASLADLLTDFSHPPHERRHYRTYPFGEGKVFVKSFVEKGIAGSMRNRISPRGEREYRLGRRLIALSIKTPVMYGYGISPSGSAVVQEWIAGESFIATFLKSADRPALVVALAQLLKDLKRNHVLHNDLHLDNILVSEGALYLIDLHKMRIKRLFSRKDEMGNLSHALAMAYGVMSEGEKEAFFCHYGNTGIRTALETTLRNMHHRWIQRKQRRAFEDTSHVSRKGDYLCVIGREERGQGAFIETIKRDKKVIVERYEDHIRKIYSSARRLKRAWRAHIALTYLDIPVIPETFCMKMAQFSSPGYICMEDLSQRGEELDRRLDRVYDTMSLSEREDFAGCLARFFGSSAGSGVTHRDVKGCNIFVLDDGTFRFLDVEDIIFQDVDADALKRMLLQLNTTVPRRIGLRHRIGFAKYLAESLNLHAGQIIRDVARSSQGEEIVYEGIDGLKRESW